MGQRLAVIGLNFVRQSWHWVIWGIVWKGDKEALAVAEISSQPAKMVEWQLNDSSTVANHTDCGCSYEHIYFLFSRYGLTKNSQKIRSPSTIAVPTTTPVEIAPTQKKKLYILA